MHRLLALALSLFFLLSQAVGLQRCATPTPPRGGDRDTIGPQLVVEATTPNFRTNFRPERIELTFDEWVELDPQQQIFVSPPIDLTGANRPFLKRRTLTIPLEGVTLLDSVTYVVNVGAAVKDLNEGNPTENLRFVFATGPVLDTATVSGRLVDAFSGAPLEGTTFTLFANLADTATRTENPTYFAQADEEGRFTVYNVRPGDYRAVALLRNPGSTNYYADYDGVFPPLSVGFLDTTIRVVDTDNRVGEVRLSPVPIDPRINDFVTDEYGEIRLTLNQPATEVDLRSSAAYLRSNDRDTLRLFYRSPVTDTILVGRGDRFTDTLFFTAPAATAPALPLRVVSGTGGQLVPGRPVLLHFNRPLETVDTSRVRLLRDTFPEPVAFVVVVDSLDSARLKLRASWATGAPYRLRLLPGAVTDWFGQSNPDTIVRPFNVEDPERFGTLTLRLENLNPTLHYLLRLVREDEVITGTRRTVRKQFDYTVRYTGLKPDTYRVELIYDSNENDRYDSGDLRFGLQPEVVRRIEIEPLRANWELEEVIDLSGD